jgi:hypothetical protein
MIGTQFRASENLLWLLIAIYAVASLPPSFAPRALSLDTQLALVVVLPLAFALIHGAMRLMSASIPARRRWTVSGFGRRAVVISARR